jgi:biopolymer transport protein ExbD
MNMAFGSFSKGGHDTPMAEINMIPLIDVMLVLLVIFIVTAPLLTHAVKIDLPKASSSPNVTKPENIQLGLRADGQLFWNGESVEESVMNERIAAAAKLSPQPEVHIRAERQVHYERVAKLMSQAAKAGLTRIGFVTDPSAP